VKYRQHSATHLVRCTRGQHTGIHAPPALDRVAGKTRVGCCVALGSRPSRIIVNLASWEGEGARRAQPAISCRRERTDVTEQVGKHTTREPNQRSPAPERRPPDHATAHSAGKSEEAYLPSSRTVTTVLSRIYARRGIPTRDVDGRVSRRAYGIHKIQLNIDGHGTEPSSCRRIAREIDIQL
jgi:hypothetical protein